MAYYRISGGLMLAFSLIRVLKIKWQWVLLGAAATALSILFASRLIPNPKMVPLVPMIVGIAALSVITLFDRNDEENKAWTISAWGLLDKSCHC